MDILVLPTEREMPLWGSAKTVKALFEIGPDALARAVAAGLVKAKKLQADCPQAGLRFKLVGEKSVTSWLEMEG